MHILRKHYMFLNQYKYVLVLGPIFLGACFLFSTERETDKLLKHFVLRPQKDLLKIFFMGEYLDYLEFIQNQIPSKKLQWKQFQEIHELGKSISSLLTSCEAKQDIELGVSILQVSRNQGIEECFQQLKESGLLEKEDAIFKAAFFSFIVEIAKKSPESFNKEAYLNLKRMKKALMLVKNKSAKEAFSYYKTKLANQLELDLDSVLDRHLLKIALKKRIYSLEEIGNEKKSLLDLSFDKLQEVIRDERAAVDLL